MALPMPVMSLVFDRAITSSVSTDENFRETKQKPVAVIPMAPLLETAIGVLAEDRRMPAMSLVHELGTTSSAEPAKRPMSPNHQPVVAIPMAL